MDKRYRPSQRHRVLVRAARAWMAGKPHEAWTIVHTAGLDRDWPELQRSLLRRARQRYERRMTARV